jgi:hypothetical protein
MVVLRARHDNKRQSPSFMAERLVEQALRTSILRRRMPLMQEHDLVAVEFPTIFTRASHGDIECSKAIEELIELRTLLKRLWGWDHMDFAADGQYWRAEIERVVTGIG